jgi:hypothetical protein
MRAIRGDVQIEDSDLRELLVGTWLTIDLAADALVGPRADRGGSLNSQNMYRLRIFLS